MVAGLLVPPCALANAYGTALVDAVRPSAVAFVFHVADWSCSKNHAPAGLGSCKHLLPGPFDVMAPVCIICSFSQHGSACQQQEQRIDDEHDQFELGLK